MSMMSTEQMLKDLHLRKLSKSLGCSTKNAYTPIKESGHVSPFEDEYEWKPHVYNGFPQAQRIRKPIMSSKRCKSSTGNSQSTLGLGWKNSGDQLDKERAIHLPMPCFEFNHDSEICVNSRRKDCSFVTNNKVNMRRKGLDINNLYSFKQSKRGTSGRKISPDNLKPRTHMIKPASANVNTNNGLHLEKSSSHPSASLTKTFSKSRNKTAMPCDIPSVLQFDGSSKSFTESPMYGRLIRGLEREIQIPGHIRADDTTGKRLGKVLTKSHLENILTEEEQVVPPTFYITA